MKLVMVKSQYNQFAAIGKIKNLDYEWVPNGF